MLGFHHVTLELKLWTLDFAVSFYSSLSTSFHMVHCFVQRAVLQVQSVAQGLLWLRPSPSLLSVKGEAHTRGRQDVSLRGQTLVCLPAHTPKTLQTLAPQLALVREGDPVKSRGRLSLPASIAQQQSSDEVPHLADVLPGRSLTAFPKV